MVRCSPSNSRPRPRPCYDVLRACLQAHASRAPLGHPTEQVGVSFGNRQEIIKKTAVGEPLLVVREPTNPVDPNAVAVLTIRGEQLGYVKKVPPH